METQKHPCYYKLYKLVTSSLPIQPQSHNTKMSFSSAQRNMASRIEGFEKREKKHIEMKERTLQRIEAIRDKKRKMHEVRAEKV